jgi:hypothetical protein
MTDTAKSKLIVAENLAGRGDDFYAMLVSAHDGLSEAESYRLNARLVLLLANHIGDLELLKAALMRARQEL